MKNGDLTGYPSLDNPQSKDASFFEKHPIIPSLDIITILKLLSKKIRNLNAINCNELIVSYQKLIDDSHLLAKSLKELGVSKGDIITISLPSNYQAISLFFALNEIGAITTFIDTYASEEEILNYLNNYESKVYIAYNKTIDELQNIKNSSKVDYIISLSSNKVNITNLNNNLEMSNDWFIDYHSLGSIAKYKKNFISLPNKGSDDSLILYTSGSTGQPKSVVLTNKNVLAAQIYARNTSHTENITGMKTMTCVPLRYPYGMVTSLLTSLLWGKEAIMTPNWDSNTVKYYYSKNPNIIFGSPAVLDLTMRFLPKNFDLSNISHFISGGDFLTIKHAEMAYDFFKEHNNNYVEIGNGCGNAETVSIGSTPVGVPLKQSTAGKILVGSSAMIIDKDIKDDIDISNNPNICEKKYYEIGELCISGKHVFKEYYGEPEKTKYCKFIKNGKTYFRTGTLGFIDIDGYFTPVDRKSRFYIRSTGHKVYLDNVQNIISCSDDRIFNCAVVKVPDENELYVNKAYVVLKKNIEQTEELMEEIFEKLYKPICINGKIVQLKEYEIPKYMEFSAELPRIIGTEKIDYSSLENDALKEINKEFKKIRRINN